MDNIQFALRAIPIGTVIAIFLLNTNRILQGMELLSECLFLLNNFSNVLGKENMFVRTFSTTVYLGMFQGYQVISDYPNAIECGKKVLVLHRENNLTDEQGKWSLALSGLYNKQSNYKETKELYMESLHIAKKMRDETTKEKCYSRLGVLFFSLFEYQKAEEYLEKALTIRIDIGDKHGEAADYANLGTVFSSLVEFHKAEEYLKKALRIPIEIGDKSGEASSYANLGTVFSSLVEFHKAEEYLKKALKVRIEILDREGQAADYIRPGSVSLNAGDFISAKECYDKSFYLTHEISSPEVQFNDLLYLRWWTLFSSGNIHEAVSILLKTIQKSEQILSFLKDNDQFKISFLDEHVSPYKWLSRLFTIVGKFNEAICVEELARARALADTMSAQYSVGRGMPVDPQAWVEIQRIIKPESDCACLYIYYHAQQLSFGVIKSNKPVVFRQKEISDLATSEAIRTVDEGFADMSFRSFHLLPTQEQCEDRSLSPSNSVFLSTPRRLIEGNEGEEQYPEPLSLEQYYNLFIDPVADLLDQPEIIIVPEGPLYRVPFAALKDKNEKYLSEYFRIRIVPSLTTLKLIQDCPADYHSQTGALIVGEPGVAKVYYKGRVEKLCPLPIAREEAQMIGRLIGVEPLVGEHATKQAVLDDIHSVSLIHFAAHGDAERGEIALAPPRPYNGIPHENDYLLTMAEVEHVRLTAKLVVLSCCHSANGEIRSEGVVGIARAFLGSGARSVLVSLWAIEDNATKQFMSRFYEHLVRGESASESLHQAMKWMRNNGFPKVHHWAPFMLIGDNVTFDFGK